MVLSLVFVTNCVIILVLKGDFQVAGAGDALATEINLEMEREFYEMAQHGPILLDILSVVQPSNFVAENI